MNPRLMNLIKRNTPEIDPRLGDGLAYGSSKDIQGFVDKLFRINAPSYPVGLEYLGCEKAPPHEGYRYMTRLTSNNVRRYDINRNDVRLYNFIFKYQGEIIKKQLYLPFIRRHNLMHMNGVKYTVSPVVADGVITVKTDSIFVKLIKAKLWFEKLEHLVVIDGKPEHVPVYHSQVYNKKPEDSSERKIKVKATLVLYLLSKYGMDQTLRLMGFKKKAHMLTRDEFIQNQVDYPKDQWVVVESTGKKPPRTYLEKMYFPLKYVFLVDRKEFETISSSKSVLGTIIYTLDHFTKVNEMNPDIVNDTDAWRSMLGVTICQANEHYATIKETVDKHMLYVDEYIDVMVRDGFERIGLGNITDIYQLFIFIIEKFTDLVTGVNKITDANSLYKKQLLVLDFLLFNIIKAVNLCYFDLSGLRIEQEKNPDKIIKIDNIKKALGKIRTEEIFKIKSHAEITPVEDPTDLPLLKIGRMVVAQEKSDKQRTSKTTFSVDDPINVLHESLIECGAALDMSKADPAGHNRINLFVKLSDDNTIVPNPELEPYMAHVRELLYGKS